MVSIHSDEENRFVASIQAQKHLWLAASNINPFVCKKPKVSGQSQVSSSSKYEDSVGLLILDCTSFPCITNLDVYSGSLDGKIKRNNLLTTVTTFGPFFRISFDLTINSFLPGLDGLSNILSMIPAQQSPLVQINVNNVGRLDFGLGKSKSCKIPSDSDDTVAKFVQILIKAPSTTYNYNSDPGISLRCPSKGLETRGRMQPGERKAVRSWMECAKLCRERSDCRYWTMYNTTQVELQTNLREVSQCPEKASIRASSLLKVPTTINRQL